MFAAQNTTKHLAYEEFEERLTELKILTEDEVDALNDCEDSIMPIIKFEEEEVLICKKKPKLEPK